MDSGGTAAAVGEAGAGVGGGTAPAEDEAGTIAAVTKPGYRLHDRVIRPAEVGVYQSP